MPHYKILCPQPFKYVSQLVTAYLKHTRRLVRTVEKEVERGGGGEEAMEDKDKEKRERYSTEEDKEKYLFLRLFTFSSLPSPVGCMERCKGKANVSVRKARNTIQSRIQ